MALEDVCVVIPMFNASATVVRAAASALDQPEVREVVVIDDGSTDDGAARILALAEGSPSIAARLHLIRLDRNAGPAAARNHAIARSKAEFIAVLDADDILMPRRFNMMDDGPWDLLADNILFVPEGCEPAAPANESPAPRVWRRQLELAEFIHRNIPKRGKARAELGFLKPVMRRSSLDRLGLRYDERLRLGEDFLLYATALARGARFQLSSHCGYLAVERAGSLSGSHGVRDLRAFAAAVRLLAGEIRQEGSRSTEPTLLRRHLASIEQKIAVREFLIRKKDKGIGRAVGELLASPIMLASVLQSIAHDKARRRLGLQRPRRRLLIESREFRIAGSSV